MRAGRIQKPVVLDIFENVQERVKFCSSYFGVLVVSLTTKSRQMAHPSFPIYNLSLSYYNYKDVTSSL